MFDKFKDLAKMKSLQKSIQEKEFISEKEGIKVIIDGSFNIKDVFLNSDLNKGEQEKILKDCLNDVFKKARLSIAQEFSQII